MSCLFVSGAKVLELQLQHQSFHRVFRVDFLRTDWFDLLDVQGTLESSLAPQFESSDSSALSFFTAQLSYPYMTTGKTTALFIWTFVSKVMPLLFNMLSRFVAFFPRSEHLLI